MSGFVLQLGRLAQGSSRIQAEVEAPELGLAAADWSGPIRGDLGVERNGERIMVRGSVHALARLQCVRCLEVFELPIDVPVESFAERSGTGSRRDEIELERDDTMRFHDGRTLDLSGPVREALLLELPIAPHCREDCQGLCLHCGANRNVEPCTCDDAAPKAS